MFATALKRLVSSPAVYSLGAPFYDWLTHHGLQEEAFAALSQRLPKEGKILDVCCGPGVLLSRLHRDAPRRELFGADAAAGALERVSRGFTVVNSRAESLPFPDRHFDAVNISGALYLVDDPAVVLKEMARVSKGVVTILEASPKLQVGTALEPFANLGIKERLDIVVWDFAMRMSRRFTPGELTRHLEAAGLHDIGVEEVNKGLYLIATGKVRA